MASRAAEIDLVENLAPGILPGEVLPRVRTNFAGCDDAPHYCHEADWWVKGNSLHQHITMVYDHVTKRVEVYHCKLGARTCQDDQSAKINPPFIELSKFPIGEPLYYLVADIW